MTYDLAAKLRAATEWDVALAMETVPIYLDAHPAALLELFNCVLDVLGVPGAGGDLGDYEDR